MSRVGKKPVILESGVKAEFKDGVLTVTGPKGSLSAPIHEKVQVKISDGELLIDVVKKEDKKERALWGLFRALSQNMVEGVTKGFEKKLEVNGVGFKVALAGTKLTLNLGFSHPIEMEVPKDLTVTVDKNVITVAGNDKQRVGQFAAEVRDLKKQNRTKVKV